MGDSEGGSRPSVSNAMLITLFKPSPSIDIVKFWQGIVEIVIRGVCLILTFILFICACAAVSTTSIFSTTAPGLARNSSAAAGWLVFVSFITLIIGGLIVAGRFLNFGFAVTYATIVHIVDICISVVIAVAIFCGAVSIAVYSGSWSALNSGVASATGATAAFGFFTIFAFVGLVVWMILSLVMKWRNVSKYSSPSSAGTDDE